MNDCQKENIKMKALEVCELSKVYRGRKKSTPLEALKKINLDVQEGDFFGLLGPNGAGKTTLIGILSSLINLSSGSVKIFGLDISRRREMNQAKSCIGLVPQEFNFNIFESVQSIVLNQAGYYGISSRVAKQKLEKDLKMLGLWEKRKTLAGQLSGGMKRRLMTARAMIHSPRMLILDEPTAGVDIELRRSMWSFLEELNSQGTTIILTTHYLEEAERLCRSIAIIDQGKIIENASTKKLVNKLYIETFIFDLLKPLIIRNGKIKQLDLSPFTFRLKDSQTLEVDLNRRQKLNDIFDKLSGLGIEVSSMRNKSNRLEELFVKMTGK